MKNNSKDSGSLDSKKIYFILITSVFSLIISFIIGEIFLRLVPLPGIAFNIFKYNNLTGVGHYPNSQIMYSNERGDFVKRKINRWGFPDVDHEVKGKKGVYRIGFFGDSYTEARQVPIDSTYFRRVELSLREYNVECLAFGISGYSTLMSQLTSNKYTEIFDLDLVIYQFTKNDLGEQIPEVSQKFIRPWPILTDSGLVIDNSFREGFKIRSTWYFKTGDFLTANSLLMSVLSSRLKFLRQYGIKTKVNKAESFGSTDQTYDKHSLRVVANTKPSRWPESLKNHAVELLSAVIEEWKSKVRSQNRQFTVLYIPAPSEWKKDFELQDSWKPYLNRICEKKEINLIDPTKLFQFYDDRGDELFFDHLTIIGHKALAETFTDWFKENIER